MKLWQKHLFHHLLKTFLFFFLCIFAIYVIVDLSIHGVKFFAKSSFLEIVQFYLSTLTVQLELFLPLAFLLSLLRVLFDLHTNRELLSLQMAGLSKKHLLLPFFIFAFFLSSVSYINQEFFLPKAQGSSLAFKGAHKEKKIKKMPLYTLTLPDESTLVYQSFDKEKKELFDVFWVRSFKEIWHMKVLETTPLKGRFVHHFARNGVQLEKKESFVEREFPEIGWDEKVLFASSTPFEQRALSTLLLQRENKAALSHFYYKLLLPLTPILILFAIAPLCLRFGRNRPFFLIAAVALFSFIALKVILDGMLILGENQVLPATLAIFTPIISITLMLTPSFVKMK